MPAGEGAVIVSPAHAKAIADGIECDERHDDQIELRRRDAMPAASRLSDAIAITSKRAAGRPAGETKEASISDYGEVYALAARPRVRRHSSHIRLSVGGPVQRDPPRPAVCGKGKQAPGDGLRRELPSNGREHPAPHPHFATQRASQGE
jgi:hypothetical protein